MPVKVFCSYSHRDRELKERFEEHLSPLKRSGRIDRVWSDGDLPAGMEFDPRIREALDAADLILFLVSPGFIDSDYCYKVEMPRAIERYEGGKTRFLFILIRAVHWKIPSIEKYTVIPRSLQAIDSSPNRDEAFAEVVGEIDRVIGEIEEHLTRLDPNHGPDRERTTDAPTDVIGSDDGIFHCRLRSVSPVSVRVVGLTELLPDIVMLFAGDPGERRYSDIWLYLNTNLTSRLTGSGNLSEATLSLATGYDVTSLPTLRHGIRGVQSAANALAFLHVPIHELRSLPESDRNLRISGVRVNAFQLGFSTRSITQIQGYIRVSDTTVSPNPTIPIAINTPAFQFAISAANSRVDLSAMLQAASFNTGMVGGLGTANDLTALLRFAGRLASFEPVGERTRLFVRFHQVREGVALFVTTEHLNAMPSALSVTLTRSDSVGNGPFDAPKIDGHVMFDGRALALSRVDVQGGSGHATWELDGGLLEE
jgi:hypothetical protein